MVPHAGSRIMLSSVGRSRPTANDRHYVEAVNKKQQDEYNFASRPCRIPYQVCPLAYYLYSGNLQQHRC